jgi:hypothetical protein
MTPSVAVPSPTETLHALMLVPEMLRFVTAALYKAAAPALAVKVLPVDNTKLYGAA